MAVFTVIDHTEVGAAGVTSWEVTGISASYDHLYLVASWRSDDAEYLDDSLLYLNSDTGTTLYSCTRLMMNANPSSERSTVQIRLVNPGSSVTADTFGTVIAWIPNYANTANFKSVVYQGAVEGATTATNTFLDYLGGGLFQTTAAVTAVKIEGQGSDKFVQYSTFTLYGVTGA